MTRELGFIPLGPLPGALTNMIYLQSCIDKYMYIQNKAWDEITDPFQTSTVVPLKFGNGWVISSHTMPCV